MRRFLFALLTIPLLLGPTGRAAAPPRGPTWLPEQPLPEGAKMRLGTTLFRSSLGMTVFRSLVWPGCCLSKDGRFLAVGQKEGLRVWDLHTGKVRAFPHGRKAIVCQPVAFSPDGRFLLATVCEQTGEDDSCIACAFEVSTGQVARYGRWVRRDSGRQTFAFVKGPPCVLRIARGGGKEATAEVWDLTRRIGVRRLSISGEFATSDDTLVTAGDRVGEIRLWRLPLLKPLRQINTGYRSIQALALSPDGHRVAFAGTPAIPRIRDCRTGKTLAIMEGTMTSCGALTFSPDGRYLLGEDEDGEAYPIWDSRSGRRLATVIGPSSPARGAYLTFSPDGSRFAFCAASNVIEVRELPSCRRLSSWTLPQHRPRGLAFTPDGRCLLVKGPAPSLWDVLSGLPLYAPASHALPVSLAFSPDSRSLLTFTFETEARLWRLRDGSPLLPFGGVRPTGLVCLDFSGDGRFFHCVDTVGVFRSLDLPSGKVVREAQVVAADILRSWFRIPNKPRESYLGDVNLRPRIALGNDGSYAYLDLDNWLNLRRAATGRTVNFSPRDSSADRLTFSPGGCYLAVLGRSVPTTLSLWRVADRRRLFRRDDEGGSPWDGTFSPDGRFYLWPTKVALRRFDLSKGKELEPLRGHRAAIKQVVFNSHGKLMATVSPEDRICLWEMPAGRLLATYSVPGDATPRGGESTLLALVESADNGDNRLLDLRTGRQLSISDLRQGRPTWALTPDERILVAGTDAVTLYELHTGSPIVRLPPGHLGRISHVAFSPDGRTLGSGGEDTTVLLWDWKRLCRLSGQRRGRLDAHRLNSLWRTLAQDDAGEAYRAMGTLIAHPEHAIKLLGKELAAVTANDLKDFQRIVADLDSDDFATRRTAEKQLADLEWLPHLRRARDSKPPLEVHRRIERALERTADKRYSSAMLRRLRAVQVLEEIGSPDARKLLAALARGHEDSVLTEQAKAALKRLGATRRAD